MCDVWHDDEMMDLGDAGMLAMEREIIWTLLAPCLMLAESSQLNVIIWTIQLSIGCESE